MAKLAAFSLFACAAFSWSLPWLDRAGTAALALGFMALSVGRALPSVRGARREVALPAALDHPERIVALTSDYMERFAQVDGQ